MGRKKRGKKVDGSESMSSSDSENNHDEVDEARDQFMNHLRQFMESRGFVLMVLLMVLLCLMSVCVCCLQNTFGYQDAYDEWEDD